MKGAYLTQNRIILGRWVFTFYLLALLFRFLMYATPSGMLQPVLFRFNFDFTYWLFDLIGIFNFVLHSSPGSILFDVLLFVSCILCIVYPLRYYFAILFLFYTLSYNAAIVHHSHPLSLMTLATVAFFFKSVMAWKYMWEGFRYYVCYCYFISFIWKAFIGKSLFFWDMGYVTAKGNLVEYLYYYPDTIMSLIYSFFLSHPTILNLGLILVFLLEALMVVGFFTKKWDHILLVFPIVIHISTYFFSDVYFFEMLVGVFAFKQSTALIKCNLNNNIFRVRRKERFLIQKNAE